MYIGKNIVANLQQVQFFYKNLVFQISIHVTIPYTFTVN